MSNFYTSVRVWGNNILYMGYKNGERIVRKIGYKPELFIRNNTPDPSDYSCYDGTKLQCNTFNTIKDAKNFIEKYKAIDNFKIYGTNNFPAQFISKYFKKDVDFDYNLIRIATLDIEVWSKEEFPKPEDAKYPITLLSWDDSKTNKTYAFGTKPLLKNIPNVEYFEYSIDKEKEMLAHFLAHWKMNYPDVITGWNSWGFDVQYIAQNAVEPYYWTWNAPMFRLVVFGLLFFALFTGLVLSGRGMGIAVILGLLSATFFMVLVTAPDTD